MLVHGDSVHDKVYIQFSIWHLEPYPVRKICEFILIYNNGPFKVKTYQNKNNLKHV